MKENNETFNYTHSTRQKDEVKGILEKYIPREENKMEQVRRLDREVEKRGIIASLASGTVGTLIFGLGLTCILVWTHLFVLGIIIGIIGLGGMGLALPVYNSITKKEREKLAPQIRKLSEELLK